jgi:hypothetical protein
VQQGPAVQDEEGLDCRKKCPTVQNEDGPDCREKGPTLQDEEGLDYHEQVVFDQRRSTRAVCRARRNHRQTVKRHENRRKNRRVSRATLQDDGLEPIHLTNMAQGRRLFSRRHRYDRHRLHPGSTLARRGQAPRQLEDKEASTIRS